MSDGRKTFTEQLTLLLAMYQESSGTSAQLLARTAIRNAYIEVPTVYDWSYFARRYTLNTVAPYSTGTVIYDSSAGTFTLSGGTWPTWAVRGQLWINDVKYGIRERVSSTVLKVDTNTAPGDDIASTEFTLLSTFYDLPPDFWRMQGVARSNGLWLLLEVRSNDRPDFHDAMPTPGTPISYAFVSIPSVWPGQVGLELIPAPDTAMPITINYRARSRPWLTLQPITEGTISISGTTVTGVGTTFPATASGMVLRVGTSGKSPTGLDGAAPYTAQYVVADYVSATQLTLYESGATVSGVKFSMDDPVDIDPLVMGPYFDSYCAEWYERLARKSTLKFASENRVLTQRMAQAQDNKSAQKEIFWNGSSWPSFPFWWGRS